MRELRRVAREVDADETTAALLVEVAVAADLVAESDGIAPEWVPTTAADVWAAAGPEQQWAVLARAWLDLPRLPGLVGARDDAGRPIAALVRRPAPPDGAARPPPGARRARRAAAGNGRRAAERGLDGRARRGPRRARRPARWRAPRRGGRLRDEVVRWTLAEATVLGVVALDALSTPGRTLLARPGPGRPPRCARALPEPIDHVLLQADLTAVAPGPLEPELERELDLVGEVESAGGATVYRFTEATVRRALDAGRTAAELHELFATRSATPVPQGLTYLVDDVARRHGRLRGGAAASFLRSDDEVLIAEVLASPAAGPLELRRIAPTVAVSPLPLAELMDGLRDAGLHPRGRGRGRGGARPVRPRPAHGTPAAQPATARCGRPSRTPHSWPRSVARMRAGDALVGVRRGAAGEPGPPTPPSTRCARPPASAAACGSASSTGTGWRASRCWSRRASAAGSSRAATAWTAACTASRCTGSPRSRSSRTDPPPATEAEQAVRGATRRRRPSGAAWRARRAR